MRLLLLLLQLLRPSDLWLQLGLIYHKSDQILPTTEIAYENSNLIELVFVRGRKKMINGCCYRPQHNRCFNFLSKALEKICTKYSTDHNILVADMNISGINWRNCTIQPSPQEHRLKKFFCYSHPIWHVPMGSKLTRIQGNTLDFFCSISFWVVHDVEVIYPGLSNHCII